MNHTNTINAENKSFQMIILIVKSYKLMDAESDRIKENKLKKKKHLKCLHTRQKYLQLILSLGQFGVLTATPSNGPNLVPRGITPVLQTPSV